VEGTPGKEFGLGGRINFLGELGYISFGYLSLMPFGFFLGVFSISLWSVAGVTSFRGGSFIIDMHMRHLCDFVACVRPPASKHPFAPTTT
jgi:hypothetical protein